MTDTAHPTPTDRYTSFKGIDFEANMNRVLAHLRRHLELPGIDNALWRRFIERLALADQSDTPTTDRLLLLHSHVYYLSELFEDAEDEAAITDLARLERECF